MGNCNVFDNNDRQFYKIPYFIFVIHCNFVDIPLNHVHYYYKLLYFKYKLNDKKYYVLMIYTLNLLLNLAYSYFNIIVTLILNLIDLYIKIFSKFVILNNILYFLIMIDIIYRDY